MQNEVEAVHEKVNPFPKPSGIRNAIDKALPYGLVALCVPCSPSPLQMAVTTPQLAASLTTRAVACAQDQRRRVCRVRLHRRVRQGRPVNVAEAAAVLLNGLSFHRCTHPHPPAT